MMKPATDISDVFCKSHLMLKNMEKLSVEEQGQI